MTRQKQKLKGPEDPRRKLGRKSNYDPEHGDWVCNIIATHGMGLDKMQRMYPGFPSSETIYKWCLDYEQFAGKYAQAKIQQATILAHECLEIADDDSHDSLIDEDGKKVANTEYIARSRLRIDTRKWLAAKLLPKTFGNQAELEEKRTENEQLKKEIEQLRADLDETHRKDY